MGMMKRLTVISRHLERGILRLTILETVIEKLRTGLTTRRDAE
jgi:hypothetical protein